MNIRNILITVVLVLTACRISYSQPQQEIVGALGYGLAYPCELAVNDADSKYKMYNGNYDGTYNAYYGGRYIDWDVSKFHIFCYGGMLAAIQIDFDGLSSKSSIGLYDNIVAALIAKYGDYRSGSIDPNQQLIPLETEVGGVVIKQYGISRQDRSIYLVLKRNSENADGYQLFVTYWDNIKVKLMFESNPDY